MAQMRKNTREAAGSRQGLGREKQAIRIGEYKLPGAKDIALEKNVRAGARKRKCSESRSYVDIVYNQTQGQRDLKSNQEWTHSDKDQMGSERNQFLLGCSEGEGGSHDSFTLSSGPVLRPLLI